MDDLESLMYVVQTIGLLGLMKILYKNASKKFILKNLRIGL